MPLTQGQLEDIAELRARAAEKRRQAKRLTEQANRASENAPGSFVTGRSGRTRAMDRRTDRALELTIKNAKKSIALNQEADALEHRAWRIENQNLLQQQAAQRAQAKKEARKRERDRRKAERAALRNDPKRRVFIGNYPAGLIYADRCRKKRGDYAQLAFLSYFTLKLDIEPDCPDILRPYIEEHAATLQARRGEPYQVSSCGQYVILGDDLD